MRLFFIVSFVIVAIPLVVWFTLSVQPIGLSAPVTLLIITILLVRFFYRLLSMTRKDRRHHQRAKHVRR